MAVTKMSWIQSTSANWTGTTVVQVSGSLYVSSSYPPGSIADNQTPTETDGKVTNVYMLDPTALPSFQIVVRLPPAAIAKKTAGPIWLNSLNIDVDRMNIIWGDLAGVLEMGSFVFNTRRGSFNAGHLSAQKATVLSAYNDVAGTFNISESLLVNVSE
jgi:hypothetical protein